MFMAADEFPLPHEYRFFRFDGLQSHPPEDLDERTIVFLDCGNIDRNPIEAFKGDDAHILNIDHHHDNTRFGTVNHVVEDASCTAEIVWDLMDPLSVAPTIEIAEALYVGLVTDTGKFMYENTGPRAHVMAAELIAAGIDVHGIYRRLYEGMPFAKLELLGRALARLERVDDGALTFAYLDRDDFRMAGRRGELLRGHHRPPALGRGHEGRRARARAARRRRRAQEGVAALDGRRRSTSRRSPAPGAAAATAAPPGSRPSCPTTSSSPSCASRSPPSCSGPLASRLGGRTRPRRQAGGQDLARPDARHAPRASACARPATRARSTRSRPGCCSCSSAARGVRSASSWRCRRPTRRSRGSARSRRPATPRARSPRPACCRRTRSCCRPARVRQRPPIYSAVRVQGRRAYERARRGEAVEVPEREVTVYRFEQRWREGDRAGFVIDCSSGTYVRSLIADLGDAYCEELRRTRVGPFDVADADPTRVLPLEQRAGFLPRVDARRRRGVARGPRPDRRRRAAGRRARARSCSSTRTARSPSPSRARARC